jgi:sulfopyruvate decarboxylase subunit alpha
LAISPAATIVLVAVSETGTRALHRALKEAGITVVVALPESWIAPLVRELDADAETRLVLVAREEEGVGICAGAHLAGTRAALLMQNHGFLQSVNGVVSLAMLYRIPLLMLVSDRGHLGEKDPWQTEGGRYTRPVLESLNIVYDELREPEQATRQVADAAALAASSLAPVALLLTRQLMLEPAR